MKTNFAKTGANIDERIAGVRKILDEYKAEFKTAMKFTEDAFKTIDRKGFERAIKKASKVARDHGNVVLADLISKISYAPGDETP